MDGKKTKRHRDLSETPTTVQARDRRLPLYGNSDTHLLSLYYQQAWSYSHSTWRFLKRIASEEINQDLFEKELGDLRSTLRIIKEYENKNEKRNPYSAHRYKYIESSENIFKSVEEKIKEQIKNNEERFSPKQVVTSTLLGFCGVNDLAESFFLWYDNVKVEEIKILQNSLIEQINENVDMLKEKRAQKIRSELSGINIPRKYFTYLLLDCHQQLSKDKILYGHSETLDKIKDRNNDIENAVDYVINLGKYGTTREAHYPYILRTLLLNVFGTNQNSISIA